MKFSSHPSDSVLTVALFSDSVQQRNGKPPPPSSLPPANKTSQKTRDLGWVRKFRIALQFQDFLWYCLTFPCKHLYHCETRLEWDTNKGTPLKLRVAVRLHSLRTHICKIEIITLISTMFFFNEEDNFFKTYQS